jgi:epoxyqueuosine reductase
VTPPQNLTAELKREAAGLGFALAGACPAVTPTGVHRFYEWLDAGYGGQMDYLQGRRPAYEHPRHVLEGVRSLLLVALPYRAGDPQPGSEGYGKVSCYAWGNVDYHDFVHGRLKQLGQVLLRHVPAARFRGVVDTAPLLEREFAQLAGLGWIGKNTLLLNPQLGSWFFLAALLTDVELVYDEPFTQDHCGTCRACLDACPTDAFVEPYVLDATRCISYLTIELRDAIPQELRAGLGDWIFGCDVCQDVCPWNNHAPRSLEAGFAPREPTNPVALARLFDLDEESFRAHFRRTPLWRARRRGILRNAAIVLGNQRVRSSLGVLQRAADNEDAIVREACEWAIGQIRGAEATTEPLHT